VAISGNILQTSDCPSVRKLEWQESGCVPPRFVVPGQGVLWLQVQLIAATHLLNRSAGD
jgi:hypothetical protein